MRVLGRLSAKLVAVIMAMGLVFWPMSNATALELWGPTVPNPMRLGFYSPSYGLNFCGYTQAMLRYPALNTSHHYDANGFTMFRSNFTDVCSPGNGPKNAAPHFALRVRLYNQDTGGYCHSTAVTAIPTNMADWGLGFGWAGTCGQNTTLQSDLVSLLMEDLERSPYSFSK